MREATTVAVLVASVPLTQNQPSSVRPIGCLQDLVVGGRAVGGGQRAARVEPGVRQIVDRRLGGIPVRRVAHVPADGLFVVGAVDARREDLGAHDLTEGDGGRRSAVAVDEAAAHGLDARRGGETGDRGVEHVGRVEAVPRIVDRAAGEQAVAGGPTGFRHGLEHAFEDTTVGGGLDQVDGFGITARLARHGGDDRLDLARIEVLAGVVEPEPDVRAVEDGGGRLVVLDEAQARRLGGRRSAEPGDSQAGGEQKARDTVNHGALLGFESPGMGVRPGGSLPCQFLPAAFPRFVRPSGKHVGRRSACRRPPPRGIAPCRASP